MDQHDEPFAARLCAAVREASALGDIANLDILLAALRALQDGKADVLKQSMGRLRPIYRRKLGLPPCA